MFSKIPEAPHIAMKWVTQTTIILKWEPLNIYAATFRGLDVYRNEQKLGLNLQHTATGCKLSGLDVNQEYDICVVVRTSAGNFTSNKITIRTLELENLTGLYPAFGSFANDADIDTLSKLLERIGAQYSDDLTSDNTHLICTLPKGPKYEKALELNIPIVTPEFLKACEQQGKVQPAHIYYSK